MVHGARGRVGGASGLRTIPAPDLHAGPPNIGVDRVGERGHVSHRGAWGNGRARSRAGGCPAPLARWLLMVGVSWAAGDSTLHPT